MNSEEVPDTTLLQQWRSGDRAAADQLLRRYTPLLRSYFARRVARNVDELVQRTLLACIQSIERFEGRSSFKSYLLGIAQNQFFMSLRTEMPHGATAAVLCTPPEDTPSQLLAVKQQERILLGALLHLNDEFRTVLEMFYWENQSVEAIAEQMQTAPGTVKSRLARGRAMLKKKILSMNLPRQVRREVLTNFIHDDGSLDE
jgi:RNA polymerase sigma-70 factor (ECF subfamily)